MPQVTDELPPPILVEEFTFSLRDNVARMGMFSSIQQHGKSDTTDEVKLCVGRFAFPMETMKQLHAVIGDLLQKAETIRAGGPPN